MSESVIYEYNAKYVSGNTYSVNPDTENVGATVTATLSPGDEFVFENKIYIYAGGADAGLGGPEVGFFALGENGKLHFFSLGPINGVSPENLVLNTSQSCTICFMAGTRIATPDGQVAIEDLAVGDLVLTQDGQSVPIQWIGRQTVSTRFADPARVLPIRIRAHALGENLPARDLLVSPNHALLVEGVLAQAGALQNGSTVARETQVPETFVYYHIETEDQSLILAEGVGAETFVDNIDRFAFDNWDEHLKLYPEGRTVKELPYPRAAAARQVPAAVVGKLAAQAEKLGAALPQAA